MFWQCVEFLCDPSCHISVEKAVFKAIHIDLLETCEFLLKKRQERISDACSTCPQLASTMKLKYRHWVCQLWTPMEIFWKTFHLKTTIEQQKKIDNIKICFEVVMKEKNWIEFEAITQKEIPLHSLNNWSKSSLPQHFDNLPLSDKKILIDWAQAIKCHENEITISLFADICLDLVSLMPHCRLLSKLFTICDRENITLFYAEDPLHMNFREQLKPGDTLWCNGIKCTLKQRLGDIKRHNNKFQFFSINEHEQGVAKMACNRLLLLLEADLQDDASFHCGFSFVKTIENISENSLNPVPGLDRKGILAIVEKLGDRLDQYHWTSLSPQLNDQDELLALAFANHISNACQLKFTPLNLSLAHIMRNEKGCIKSTHLLRKGKDNYIALEQYCIDAAKGNGFVLNFLIHVSQLHMHPIAIYFREAVSYTLETGLTDLISRPIPEGYQSESIHAKIKQLLEEAKKLREETFEDVLSYLRERKSIGTDQLEVLKQEAGTLCARLYRCSPTPGHLTMVKQEAVAQMISPPSSPPRCSPDCRLDKYYASQRAKLKNLNYNHSQ